MIWSLPWPLVNGPKLVITQPDTLATFTPEEAAGHPNKS